MKIGVFDSGVGGESVAKAIKQELPDAEVLLVTDKAHLPYGNKAPQELLELVSPVIESLSNHCDAIVIACNTVSTTIINDLREQTKTPLVAMEPMVKPAAEKTKSKIIAVCATPTTLKSKRYRWLKDTYAKGIKVLEPNCSDWSYMIEHKKVDEEKIRQRIEKVCKDGADKIVLGCTHYHWIEELIDKIAEGRAEVLQPEQPVIKQLKRVLAQSA